MSRSQLRGAAAIDAHSQSEGITREVGGFHIDQSPLEPKPSELEDDRDVVVLAPQAPWRRLPIELLSDIFVMVLTESFHGSGRALTMPTLISLVCTEWRTIALGTPHLWVCIRILDTRGLGTASLWLERSRSAPVVIQCTFTRWNDIEVSSVLGVVCSHLDHTSELNIEISEEDQYRLVIQELRKPAPMLQTLRIRALAEDDDYWVIPDNIAQSLFGGNSPPTLLSLNIISSGSKWPEGIMDHLTDLDLTALGDMNAVDTLELLENARCVTTLKLQVFGREWSSPVTVVTLPSLVDLHINGWIHQVQRALNHLNLPNLLTLTLDYDDTSGHQEIDVTGTTQSFPLLEKLRCIAAGPGPNVCDHLPLILRRCDSTRRLNIEGSPEQVLVSFVTGDTKLPCPHLAHLTFDGSSPRSNWDTFHIMVHNFLVVRSARGNVLETMTSRIPSLLLDLGGLDGMVKKPIVYNEFGHDEFVI